jgi:hypothetical protein
VVEGGVGVGRLREASEELLQDLGEQAAGRGVGRDRLQVAVRRTGVAKAVGCQERLGPTRHEVRSQEYVADVNRHQWPGL